VTAGTPVAMGWKWSPQAAGTYQLVCEANPDKTFTEATHSNNLGKALFPVALAISPEAVSEAGPALNPSDRGEKEADDKSLLLCPECFNPQPEPPIEGEKEPDPPGDPRWSRGHELRSGKAAQEDFEFEAPPEPVARALAARAPGGRPAAESAGLLEQLTARYAPRVDAENARIQALATGPRQAGLMDGADAVASADPDDYALGLDPCGDPQATLEVQAVQASPPLDPGEWVLVQGCGLGTQPGKLRLAGDFPGGHLDLDIKSWAATQVSAQLPLVTGVGDMPAARLQLLRKDGKFSNLLDVGGFRATREVRLIHPTDVIVTCGASWGTDDCTLGQSHPLSESQFFGGASFAAKHGVQTAPKDCDDSALHCLGRWWEEADLAAVHLANGWTLAGYAWWWNPLAGWSYVNAPSGFQMGSSSATIAMNWGLGLNAGKGPTQSEVRYRVDLYAVGPKGVPYK
ncbi:MAG TPA: hypothetical protein VJP59_02505, partial [Gemmatimonadota bacterium]|nr:hypothetical protein [Gemmatimonadota bacterium]